MSGKETTVPVGKPANFSTSKTLLHRVSPSPLDDFANFSLFFLLTLGTPLKS